MSQSIDDILYGSGFLEDQLVFDFSKEGRKGVSKLLLDLARGGDDIRRAALSAADLHSPPWPEIWGQVLVQSLRSEGLPIGELLPSEYASLYLLLPETELLLESPEKYWPTSCQQKAVLAQDDSPLRHHLEMWFFANRSFTSLSKSEAEALSDRLAHKMIALDLLERVLPTIEIFVSRPEAPYLVLGQVVHFLGQRGSSRETMCGQEAPVEARAAAPHALWALAPYRGLDHCSSCRQAADQDFLKKMKEELPGHPRGILSQKSLDLVSLKSKELLARAGDGFHFLLQLEDAAEEIIVTELDQRSGDHPLQSLLRNESEKDRLSTEVIRGFPVEEKIKVIRALHSSSVLHAKDRARQALLELYDDRRTRRGV